MRLARPWRIALIGTGVGLLVALVFSLWLVRSAGGRDWFLLRIAGALPKGSTLTWKSADGSLAGPLEIRGLHYDFRGNRFDAQRLRIDQGFWPLLSGHLDIHALTLEHAVWNLPRDDKPFPAWPDILPKLDSPVTVTIDKLQARDLRVQRAGVALVAFRSIDGGMELARGKLQVHRVVAVSDRGLLRLSGSYLPRDNFRTTLAGRIVLPGLPATPPALATFAAKGDIDDFSFALGGNAPTPLSVRLRLREGGKRQPHWQLDARGAQLDPRQLGIDDSELYSLDLHAQGEGGNAAVNGKLTRGALAVGIAPSRVRLEKGVLSFAPLALKLDPGLVSLAGVIALDGKDPALDLRISSKALSLLPQASSEPSQAVLASGEMRVHGRWQSWRIDGTAKLLRARQQATVSLSGMGNARGLKIDSLVATTPTGNLRGQGNLHWDPALALSADGKLDGFDPGYFLPDYPGVVSGAFQANARQDRNGRWTGDARLANIAGTLRKRRLQGEASVRFAGANGDGHLKLAIGSSRIDASGSFGDAINIEAAFAPFDLADLWADASGRLQGTIAIRGPRAAPSYAADLRGDGLRWNGIEARHLTANGTLPTQGANGTLRLAAQDFAWSGQRFEQAALTLQGNVSALHAQASLLGVAGNFSAAGTAKRQGTAWLGRIEQLQLTPARGAAWSLQTAADYRYQSGALQLQRTCLASSAGGAVCAQASGDHASVHGKALPVALVQPWLSQPAFGLLPFGSIDFDGDFRRAADAWSGHLQLRSGSGGLRIDANSPHPLVAYSDLRVDANLQPGRLDITLDAGLAQGGSIHGRARTALSANASLQGEVKLDVRQLDWMELLSADLAGPTGHLSGRLLLGGLFSAPTISGDAKLENFSAELPSLGVVLRGGTFELHGAPGGQTRLTGQVSSGGGVLRVDGNVNLGDAASAFELALRGENVVVADTPELQATMSPDLRLRYTGGTLQMRGSVGVPKARFDLERLDHSVSPSPDVVVLDPRPESARSVFRVDTDVDLQLGDAVRLRGFGLDGTLTGRLHIRDRPGSAPQATGTLDIAGKYLVYGRALEIKRGRLSYVNSAYDNPVLDISAEREFDEVTVGVRVRGTALAPETTVTSSPAMPTAEALSWLVLGRPLSTASGSEMQQISASSLALSAGSNLLAQKLGSRLGLDSAGITETRALGGSTFTIGKQVSPRLFVSYGVSLLGTGQVLTLKYLLKHGLDVSLESGSVETAASVNWRREK